MCGIAGILNFNGESISEVLIKGMTDTLYHRGPDDEGYYGDSGIALGHRRLSIIDLSSAGHQPMSNEDGTLWLVYNGEIYNYQEIALELKEKGHVFKSRTDSEVIIHAYEEWAEQCLNRFNGMWAFALWDSRKRQLFCARDRFGIKPFYYYADKNRFVFASEIKSILTDKTIPRRPNDGVIFDYLAFENNDYIDHTEETFFYGIKRLMPAHYLVVDIRGGIHWARYWDIDPYKQIDKITDEEAAHRFYELFKDSIRLRLQSEVPLGTCLSGGLDSSSIVCMINKLILEHGVNLAVIGERQKTFSACFDDKACDEREFIKAVIDKTNVETNCVFPDGKRLFDLAPKFIEDQGEPVAGTSQWAAWLVMRMVRERGVTVVLNGQGADEILAGYSSYFNANFKDLFKTLRFFQLKRELELFAEYQGYSKKWLTKEVIKHFNPVHPFRWKRRFLCEKTNPFPSWLNQDFTQVYGHTIVEIPKYKGYMDQSLYHFLTFERLPSLLRYEDRNSMVFSVEARLPFLDYRLVEYCFSLPSEQKIRDGKGKIVLRNAMKGIIPNKVQERIVKIGFATPENTWFRNDCRKEIEEIINSKSFREKGYFNGDAVMRHFQGFVKGEPVNPRPIWKYLNLELWLQQFFIS